MNAFTDLFIRRPVLATVVSLLILLIGGMAGLKLQIRQFPEMSNTSITITTLSAARSLSGDSNRLKLEVDKFLSSVRAA